MSINGTDTHTDTPREPIVHTDFKLYAIDHSNPSAHAFSNVNFIAPPGSIIHIHTDTRYHTLVYADSDGGNRPRSDYGHYFTITDKDGAVLASGVLSGIHFNTATIGVNPRFPEQQPE